MTAAAIYLFDIDGTLLRAGGAGTRALNQIFAARYGVSDAMAGIDCGGRTDPWIVREVFTRQLGRAATADEVDAVLDAYVPALERELAASTAFRVLPFVAVTLDGLAARGGVEVGLATGNIEAGARVKLSRAGLAGRFGFGGFGCDSADRAELVARAIERGVARAGACPPERVVVVGDTVHDVTAARACGVRVVAVATGNVDRARLEAAAPDVVLDDLSGLDAWHAAALA